MYGYSIAAKRYALYEKTRKNDIKIIDPKAHGIGFLYPPTDSPKNWKEDVPRWIYEMWECVNIHSGKKYKMVDCTKENGPPYNVVFPSQFARLLIEYQEHPEAKSVAPDGSPCEAETRGLLRRAHIIAGPFRYVGKETDRKWEEGDEISVLEFRATEYGRAKKIVADTLTADEIRAIGVRKTMELTKMSQHTIEKLIRGEAVKRKTHDHVLKAIRACKSRQ